MMTNRRLLALSVTLAAALAAGCNAQPIGTAPVATTPAADEETTASGTMEQGPARYVASPTSLSIAAMTASVNNTIAARANDNSLSTYWSSGGFNKPVVRAALAGRAELTSLRLKINPNVGTYTVETSEDALSWKVALASQKNTSWYPESKRLPSGTFGKHVRLTFANNGWNVNLYELDVYGGNSSAAPTPAPVATPKPVATPTPAPVVTPTPAPTVTPPPSSGTADPLVTEVFRLVNVERGKTGAKALVLSDAISKVATFRSTDMRDRNYFAHTDPDGHDPFYWLKQAGITYRTAGENIAMGQRSSADVMNAWMNSSGHKANILNTSYGKIGIGVAKTSSGTIYWTQMFTD